eukprot:CAMPEP_0117649416 /NCGR_PEP_ID=MMETSP0804-20121206/960_1 /TAXON_ID=1074897 /ORGANISM="Tetraselmis astigmatica, Strain CCMP880" /LENGTH=125 /DNA_ID=CAMNT_0005455151 /DNA_START=966 /DNA_END=1344 /DNA_ORIENTATION=-
MTGPSKGSLQPQVPLASPTVQRKPHPDALWNHGDNFLQGLCPDLGAPPRERQGVSRHPLKVPGNLGVPAPLVLLARLLHGQHVVLGAGNDGCVLEDCEDARVIVVDLPLKRGRVINGYQYEFGAW